MSIKRRISRIFPACCSGDVRKMFRRKRLGEYPYTYVRSSVMKSLLIKKGEYHKLMKMSLPEITRYLQESEYKKEINELANKYKGVNLLELAINRNLTNSFNKLKRISPPELRIVLFVYLKRIDIENIKKILRGKFAGIETEKVIASLQPAGILSENALHAVWKKDSIESVLRGIGMIDMKKMAEPLERFKKEGTLIGLESALDKMYFDEVLDFSETMPIQGRLFREFLELELEIRDIMTILMLKREGVDNKSISQYLITPNHGEGSKLIEMMMKLEDFDAIVGCLEKSQYRKYIEDGIRRLKESNTLLYLEKDIMIYLLKKTTTFTHMNPLSIQNILDYMFGKENEARNLMKLIKGKQLGVKDEFIESMIVI